MTTESLYTKGSKVWISNVNKVWEWAEILEDYNTDTKKLIIETGSRCEIKTLVINSNLDLPPLCYLEDFLVNETKNLVSLKVVHEACILNTLQLRFEKRCFYHYCGSATTIFLNPFFDSVISNAYDIFDFHNQLIYNPKPHIFAVAEKAYCSLERENYDQSITFTGKSGAGKSENANQAILYLLAIGGKENRIKQYILASLIILESFGNAKTTNHSNSSRFGKFMEIQYNENYEINGASFKMFLLDRSRFLCQNNAEQNYHVFYELCSVSNRFPYLQLVGEEFIYLNKGIISSDYSRQFNELLGAFNVLGLSIKTQDEIFHILAGILHMGNLNFKKINILGISDKTESCCISGLDQLEILAKLFSVDVKSVNAMRKWMCHKRIFSGQNEILQPMSVADAVKACAAFASFIYTKLFTWLLAKINYILHSTSNIQNFIGILDLCGFEKLDVNLFEQFCINYANEKIQQNFIQTVFKLEQEEYLREDIGWNFMRYQDNRLCVELVEGKSGIIDILEEETKTSKDDQIPWVLNVYEKCEKSKYFKRPHSSHTDFIINHFIDNVQYDSRGFLEKNRDSVFRDHVGVLMETKNDVLSMLLIDEYCKLTQPRVKRRRKKPVVNVEETKKTVICEFRKSLIAVTAALKNSNARYVRCIKSNDKGKPFEFDPVFVAQQIRIYNVLDAIQISSTGYFSRQTYTEFFHRYYCLCQFEGIKRNDLQETCRMIIYTHIENSKNVKFGETKIFLKDGSIDYLESLREEKRHRASIIIQKTVRRFLQQKRFCRIKHAVVTLQNQVRKYLRNCRVKRATEHDAAVKIQNWTKRWMSKRREEQLERISLALRNYARFHLEHKNIRIDDTEIITFAATAIQRFFRGFMARRLREKRLRQITIVQACVRRFIAKITADKLRKNRDEKVQLINKGLESKIDVLQQKIDAYMEKNLTTEELEEVETFVKDQQCSQAKNRILNKILFSKIQTLKSLGEKKVKNYDIPAVITEKLLYEESRRVNKSSLNEVFKSLIEKEEDFTMYQPLFQAYFNFDQRIERLMEFFDDSRSTIAQLSPSKINTSDLSSTEMVIEDDISNSQLDIEETVTYQGMFQLNPSDIDLMLTRLVIELNPSIINEQDAGVPSRIIFMCLRYMDILRDIDSAVCIIENYIKAVKYVVKQRNDLETIFVWLVNTYQLLNYLKQYSRIHNNICDHFHTLNNDRQTQQCFVNLDLTTRWGSLLETAQWLVRTSQKVMKTTISEPVLLSLLEFNPVPEAASDTLDIDDEDGSIFENYPGEENQQELPVEAIDAEKNVELVQEREQEQGQSQDQKQEEEEESIQEQAKCMELIEPQNVQEEESIRKESEALIDCEEQNPDDQLPEDSNQDENLIKSKQDALLEQLTDFHVIMRKCGLKRKMIVQMFKQLFDFISSILLSNLISRPEICNIYRSSLARLNLSIIDKWALYNELSVTTVALAPVKQALRLIQMQPMNDDDIYWVNKTYDQLNCNQIMKILSCYKPAYAVDKQLSPSVKQRLHIKLAIRQSHENTVLIDSEEYPISYSFRHCYLKMEEVEIPEIFNLAMLKKM